ncbi:MAG TPA: hypothetical protein VF485_10390 [Sphingomonas sp.]
MRLLLLTLALLPAEAIAQVDTSSPPAPGIAVETIGLNHNLGAITVGEFTPAG